MQKYQNYNCQGTLIFYNDIETNYNVSICITSLFEVEVIALNMPREFVNSLNNGGIFTLQIKAKDLCITSYDIYNHDIRYTMSGESYTNEVKIYASHALIGSRFIKPDSLFSSSIIEVTNGDEILGIYPYKVIHENQFDHTKEKLIIQNNITTFEVSTLHYDVMFYSVPSRNLCIKSNLLDFKGMISFSFKYKMTIKQIRDFFSELLHFLDILCGENITCTNIVFEVDDTVFDVIGYVNYPKYKLNCLQEDGFDYKCYLRQTLPKISDFKENIQEVYNNWLEIYKKYKLTFRIYDDLRLVKENHLFTINSFLQINQIIEGYERPKLNTIHKSKISLRDCLISFTEYAISLVISSKLSAELIQCINELIDKIVKDRNVYTHVDNTRKIYMDDDKLNKIIACYIYLFRTVILADIGADIRQINNRLFMNRDYQYYLKEIFGINTLQINYIISEFDKQLY